MNIERNLLPHQTVHVGRMIRYFKPGALKTKTKTETFLDASPTGTGKTYTAMAFCALMGYSPIVVCPKSVIHVWHEVAAIFKVREPLISSYEQMITGKTNRYNKDTSTWTLADHQIVIFDEAHRCKNSDTLHSQLLMSLKGRRIKILLLSATIADTLSAFSNFGCLLDFYGRPSIFHKWITRVSRDLKLPPMAALNRCIFPKYGSRMRLTVSPQSEIRTHCFKMNNADKIAEQYHIIESSYAFRKAQTLDAGSALARIVRARQAIELLKVPTFLDLIRLNRDKGRSVVMFVNFNETLHLLGQELQVTCMIHGEQSQEERINAVAAFQSNEEKIILCNIRAGGIGISLHDLHGGHPRVSIISPTWSAQDFLQCTGRIDRVCAQTATIQKVIFCAGTVEKRICDTLKKKILNLSLLNDGDLEAYPIDMDARQYDLRGDDKQIINHRF
jgi:superfamily II DNA or RNA helicase